MGNFSFISKNKNEPVINPWHKETLCEIQVLVSGKVIEKIRGIYNGYGSVNTNKDFKHYILNEDNYWINITKETIEQQKTSTFSGDIWKSLKWNEIVDNHHGEDCTSGIAVWHLNSMEDNVQLSLERSDNDSNQGDIFYDEDDEEEDY